MPYLAKNLTAFLVMNLVKARCYIYSEEFLLTYGLKKLSNVWCGKFGDVSLGLS